MKPNCLKQQEAGIDVDKTMGKENWLMRF
jgi:hypothetical protein